MWRRVQVGLYLESGLTTYFLSLCCGLRHPSPSSSAELAHQHSIKLQQECPLLVKWNSSQNKGPLPSKNKPHYCYIIFLCMVLVLTEPQLLVCLWRANSTAYSSKFRNFQNKRPWQHPETCRQKRAYSTTIPWYVPKVPRCGSTHSTPTFTSGVASPPTFTAYSSTLAVGTKLQICSKQRQTLTVATSMSTVPSTVSSAKVLRLAS